MSNDWSLRFVYPSQLAANGEPEARNFCVHRHHANGHVEHMYEFQHITAWRGGNTTFRRWNPYDNLWDVAGTIEWLSDFRAQVTFGGSAPVEMWDLRRVKNKTSLSRRFNTPDGAEYRWKQMDYWANLRCDDGKGRPVATWHGDTRELNVSGVLAPYVDHLVVTCFLNVWMRSKQMW